MTIRVVLVDDEALVRAGFGMILRGTEAIEVVGEADDGDTAVRSVRSLRPDVVLMDLRMRRMSGLEATRAILGDPDNHTRIIVLTTFDFDEYVYEALRAGVSAFLLKDVPPDQLIHAIQVVADGQALLHPSITRRLIEEFARRPDLSAPHADLDALTEREVEVMRAVGRGLSNAEVAKSLFVGEATVKTHVGNLLAKLQLRDRAQIVVRAYETGLISPGSQAGTA